MASVGDAGRSVTDLRSALECLQRHPGQLIETNHPVDPNGELAGVYVVQDGRLLLRQLRLGARSGDAVEVIAGLKAGEVVASDPVAATQAIAAQRKAAEANRD